MRDRQQFRFDHYIQLLGVKDPSLVMNTSNRKRGKNADNGAKTRSNVQEEKSQQLVQRVYVANWHYPPSVISAFMWNHPKYELHTNWMNKGPSEEFVATEMGGEVESGYKPIHIYPEPLRQKETKKKPAMDYPILAVYSKKIANRDYHRAVYLKKGKLSSASLAFGVIPSPEGNFIEVPTTHQYVVRTRHEPSPALPTVQEVDDSSPAMNTRSKNPPTTATWPVVVTNPRPRARRTSTPQAQINATNPTPPTQVLKHAMTYTTGVAKEASKRAKTEHKRAETLASEPPTRSDMTLPFWTEWDQTVSPSNLTNGINGTSIWRRSILDSTLGNRSSK